jgi:hypothetical protein
MLAIMMNSWLPKLYAFSAMWTLNSRKGIAQSAGLITSSEWHRYTENHLNLSTSIGQSIELRTSQGTGLPSILHAGEYNGDEGLSPGILHEKRERSARLPEAENERE